MKKTLKILMAIILFAVVLSLATCVNAVAPSVVTSSELDNFITLDDGKLTEDLTTLKVDSTITLDMNDYDITTIEVQNGGNLTLKNTGVNGNSTIANAIVVKEGGSLSIDASNLTLSATADYEIENKGTVSVTKGTVTYLKNEGGKVNVASRGVVTNLTTDVSLTFDETSISKVIITDAAATVEIKENRLSATKGTGCDADIVLVKEKDESAHQIFTSYKNIKVSIVLMDENGKTVTGADKGSYAIDPTVSYNGIELDETVSFAVKGTEAANYLDIGSGATVPNDNTSYAKLTVSKSLGDKVFYLIPTIQTSVKLDDVAIPTSTSSNEPVQDQPTQEQPADQTPVTPADQTPADQQPANNSGLDDEANVATGDYIIPATALLAVVVVANVIYFAKSKRA